LIIESSESLRATVSILDDRLIAVHQLWQLQLPTSISFASLHNQLIDLAQIFNLIVRLRKMNHHRWIKRGLLE